MATPVTCPSCGTPIDVENIIAQDLKKQYDKEFRDRAAKQDRESEAARLQLEADRAKFDEQRKNENELFKQRVLAEREKMTEQLNAELRKSIAGDFENQLKVLQTENADREEKLKLARQKELEFLKLEQALKIKEEELELSLQKKLAEQRQTLADDIRKQEADKSKLKEDEYRLKLREMEEMLEAQKKLAQEQVRKAEQGSMQLQGEVQELELQELLAEAFRFDCVTEVGKGIRGADCVLKVCNQFGQECGTIIFESKRTENFSADWIEKLKKDMLAVKADVAVIVTKTMPKDLQQFGERDGVYICTFHEVKSLTTVLRNAIMKISESKRSGENKGEKMVAMYDYLTSAEFVGNMRAMREGFNQLREIMRKERESFEKNYKVKEKQIEMIIQNSLHISGSVEGIAGQDLRMELLDETDS